MIDLRPLPARALPDRSTPSPQEAGDPRNALVNALLGAPEPAEIPPLADLVAAVVDLAEGTRAKAVLPLGGRPAEYALVRRGDHVLVSHYETGGVPEIVVRDRPVPLRALLATCSATARVLAARDGQRASSSSYLRLATRLEAALGAVVPDPHARATAAEVCGGHQALPDDDVALAFGFQAQIVPSVDAPPGGSARADVHATLFEGRLWAYSRGRTIHLARGPIFLVTQRLVASVRALVDAWEADRGVHVRLRTGSFVVGMRSTKDGDVALTLGETGDATLTVPALDVPGAAEPVLRLATELLRSVGAADRAQLRNLRFTALRDEVRALRKVLRARTRRDGFVNRDPERLRLSSPPAPEPFDAAAPVRSERASGPGRLRYAERWRTEIEGLDASTTFLCGDRVVVSTPRRIMAIDRDGGEVVWARRAPRAASVMAGTALLRQTPEGAIEIWDVAEGEVVARARVAPRAGGVPVCTFAGGGDLPPMAILAEGPSRLVAVDLRTGELRWRYRARAGAFRLRRVGRILLAVCGDGAVHALDVASGEPAWRFSESTRFSLAPSVSRDVALAVSGDPAASAGTLHGLDLYSGRELWRRELSGAPLAAPLGLDGVVCVPVAGATRTASSASLLALDPRDGATLWTTPEPGLGRGGVALAVDRALVVNAPGGRVTALDLADGTPRWSRELANAATDDVPRRLEPVLRNGGLFVPASQIHALKPADGTSLGPALESDLIPDVFRVDERGWLYVAEESGHLRAYAPAPALALVR
jgi:outer membrane protein assembly factor BamB